MIDPRCCLVFIAVKCFVYTIIQKGNKYLAILSEVTGVEGAPKRPALRRPREKRLIMVSPIEVLESFMAEVHGRLFAAIAKSFSESRPGHGAKFI